MILTKDGLEKLSKSDLIELVFTLAQQVEDLTRQVAILSKNSRTSSKPPSSDQPNQSDKAKNKNKSLRKRSGRKPGGQKGHEGHTQSLVSNPDVCEQYAPDHCQHCKDSLDDIVGKVIERRQVRDIPPIQVIVTEHQKIGKWCPCGCWNEGQFPAHIKAPVQIGSNARSLVLYLNIAHVIPYQRLTQLSSDLFQFSLSEGSIDNILEDADRKSRQLQPDILNLVKQGKWVGSDESGLRVMAKRWWLWVWQHSSAVYYIIHPRRAYQVVKDHFGEDYTGSLLHDCYSAQNNTVSKNGHQQCHPHLIRDLNFAVEEERSQWAYEMKQLLLASEKARDYIWRPIVSKELRQQVISNYENKLDALTKRQLKQTEEKRLQKRFKKHQQSILFFMNDPDIPFHNNDSEKAVRNAKIKQKISGCFRSQHGAERYARLLSIIETCKKQKRNILHSINQLLDQSLIIHPT